MRSIFCGIIVFIFSCHGLAQSGLFSFLKCEEGGGQTLCRFCVASSAGGSNRVCSKPYNKNFEKNVTIGSSEYKRPMGFRSITEDLAEDMANKIIKIKNFPKENFDVKAFYEKYAQYTCEEGQQEVSDIKLQLKSLNKKDSKKKSSQAWTEQQLEFLKWKTKKVQESMAQKNCPKS